MWIWALAVLPITAYAEEDYSYLFKPLCSPANYCPSLSPLPSWLNDWSSPVVFGAENEEVGSLDYEPYDDRDSVVYESTEDKPTKPGFDSNGRPYVIVIERIEHPDGTRSWSVYQKYTDGK